MPNEMLALTPERLAGRQKVRLLVLIPIGPGSNEAYCRDTIDSIRHYCVADRAIVIIDDTGGDLVERIAADYGDEISICKTERMPGDHRILFKGQYVVNCALGLRFCYERFDFDLLLRLDTDALMCGHGIEDAAQAEFDDDPRLGHLGSIKIRCDHHLNNYWRIARRIRFEMLTPVALLKHKNGFHLRNVVRLGRKGGYIMGDHAIAPGSFFNQECIRRMYETGWLHDKIWRYTGLNDDHLFSIMVYAVGLIIGNFAVGSLPLAVWWRGIEWTPEKILRKGKMVVHSTRSCGSMTEDEVRGVFRSVRAKDPQSYSR